MKAMVYRKYGSSDVLHCEDVEKPVPGDKEVLIRIHATAANPMDYHLMAGTYIARPMTGLRFPKATCPGVDVAGEIEAVGAGVTQFHPGDHVFGGVRRAFAEYVCASEDRLAVKPVNLSFEEAAAVPVAGLTALQGLRDQGRIQPGQRVLVNGAAGGVGTFAVQIARSFGAEVTGVCSTRNVGLVQSIGANDVIDYTRDDFTQGRRQYDLILDCVGNLPLSSWRRVLTAEGTFVAAGMRPGGRWVGPLPCLLGLLVSSWLIRQRIVFYIASINHEDLLKIKGLIEAGKVRPVIDRRYPLRDVGEAVRYLRQGHARGKVVVVVNPAANSAPALPLHSPGSDSASG